MTSSASPADLILGIDLGTTNSLIALCDERGPRIIPDSAGRALLPSVVRIAENPATLADFAESVGHDARSHAVEFPHRTIYSVKRLIGRGFSDLAGDLRHLSYALQPGEHDSPRIIVNKRAYTPQQISAAILRELKSSAERALNQPVTKAVITVPAYFDDAQRQATRDAGRLAGLEVLRIVNEPTAAALAYGIGTRLTQPETIAVYDLGGGTFDISILTVTPSQSPLPPGVGEGGSEQRGGGEESGEGSSDTPSLEGGGEGVGEAHRSNSSAESSTSPSFFQVLSTAGDTHLGGDDFDQLIINLVLSEIRARFGTSLTFPPSTQQALRLFVESAKIRLSSHESADLRIDLGNSRIYSRTITRAEFESLIQPLIDRTILSCRRALKDAQLSPENINRVVMVGGSTRIPLVKKAVGDFFRCTPYTALDPDQVVALGASVQAAILSGSAKNMLLLDVIPLSLGIETVGGGIAKLIVRNSSVPARAVEMFSTSVDGQTNIKLHVLQGERELVKDCRSLATFELRGIPPMPAGIPQVEVEFLVDANGILSVNARERRSGKRAAIQVAPRYGLTREEVDRMESEAFAHARADMHAHRVIDLAVNAALDAKWITEALTRVSSELDPAYRAELSAALAHLDSFIAKSRTAPESVDADAFHRAKEDLDKTSMRLHEISIRKSLQSP